MIHKVKCVECGKKGRVLILFHKILSRKWWYFGDIVIKDLGIDTEYWECEECRKK